MLGNARVMTILPVVNMQRARDFYENTLDLKPQGSSADGKFLYACGGGATIALLPKENGTKADHTALSFEVDTIEKAIERLEAKGVVFADYDLPGLKTVNHIFAAEDEKAAWFNDTEGNILCLHEVVSL